MNRISLNMRKKMHLHKKNAMLHKTNQYD